MKIIVAGAGIGGLYAAYLFGKKGHAVTVYEKAEETDFRYDWHDDVNTRVFTAEGLKIPQDSYPKKDWTFVSPGGKMKSLTQSEENKETSIGRIALIKYLRGLAAEYADIVYGREVKGALLKDGAIKGVTFADGTEECDLLIDSCGADSVIRKNLPVTFGIDNDVSGDEFVVYRGFFNVVVGAKVEHTNKVYLKHCGKAGISWCVYDEENSEVDVLVGKIGSLDKEYLEYALEDLRKDNPILGKDLLRCGTVCKIPVRRPLDVFVADGYAAIGDAACMTVPLIGSGIETSLEAARFLFDAVGEENEATAEKLWNYETSVYKFFGARHCGIDVMKRGLLSTENSDIDMLFERNVVSNRDLQELSVGKPLKLTAKEMFVKACAGGSKLFKLIPFANMLMLSDKAIRTAGKIPDRFDEIKIAKWANKLDKLFR